MLSTLFTIIMLFITLIENIDAACCSSFCLFWSKYDACCNGKLYKKSDKMCCSGSLQTKNQYVGCCGSSSYDVRSQLCCQNTVAKGSGGANYRCCGTVTYNPDKGQSCCNNKVYVSSQNFCINGNIVPKNGNDKICGSTPFSTKTQYCCDHIVVGNRETDGCCNGQLGSGLCCNKQSFYDPYNSVCCSGKVYSRTGIRHDSIFYNECCDGVINMYVSTMRERVKCCGKKAYAQYQKACCNGVVTNLPDGIKDTNAIFKCPK